MFLDGDVELIIERMRQRQGHFMKANMLQSQFATLERPDESETDVLRVAIDADVTTVVANAVQALRQRAVVQGEG